MIFILKLFTVLVTLLSAIKVYAIPSGNSNTLSLDELLHNIPPDDKETTDNIFGSGTENQVDNIPPGDNTIPGEISFQIPYYGHTTDITDSQNSQSNFASFDNLISNAIVFNSDFPKDGGILKGVRINFYIFST